MKLLPSLRQKKRYIIFDIISSGKLSSSEIKEEVNRALIQFLGEWGLAKAAPLLIKVASSQFMLKVNHTYVDEVKAALTLSKKIKNTPLIIKSVLVSGTIKQASKQIHEVSQ